MKGTRFSVPVTSLMVVALLAGACQPVVSPPTATPEPPNRILFIGNSLTASNLGIDSHMIGLAASASPALTIETSNVLNRGYLYEHWETGKALEAIQEANWDVVVLQEGLVSVAGLYWSTCIHL